MSPIVKASQNPLNCSKHEYIKGAFCISHKLFDKNNTCTHEPLKQTCYVNREMDSIPQSNDECYEGFYARCHMNDYTKHVKDDTCVVAEGSLLEWCTCKKTVNGTETDLMVQKDCTCFPHHTKPYKIYKLNETNHNDSCVCSNIYRKRCEFPKNRAVITAAINCTSVDEALLMEELMHCEESEYVKKVLESSKKYVNRKTNPYWTRLDEKRKERLVNKRNRGKNSTEKISQKSHTQTLIKTQEESSLPKKVEDSKKTSVSPKIIHDETNKTNVRTPSFLEETTNSVTESISTINPLEANLESELSSLLPMFLGNKSYEEMDKMLKPLNTNQEMDRDYLSLDVENSVREQLVSDLSKHHISEEMSKSDMSYDLNVLNENVISELNKNYYHFENYPQEQVWTPKKSSTRTNMLPLVLIPCSLVLALIGFFLYKKKRKGHKYPNAEQRIRSEREVEEEEDSNVDSHNDPFHMEGDVSTTRKTLENNRRTVTSAINTFKNSVLYVKNPKEDKELLITNEEIIE